MNAEEKKQALALRIAMLENQTAMLKVSGENLNYIKEAGYGATVTLRYQGPITVTHIGEEQTPPAGKGFEDLDTTYMPITFLPALGDASKYWKFNLFKNRAELMYNKLTDAALTADPETRAIEEFEWSGDIRVYDVETKVPFKIEKKDENGKVIRTTKATHFIIVLLPEQSLQTEIRREIRRRKDSFLGENLEIGEEAT